MANEILVLGSHGLPKGRESFSLLFLVLIDPPIVTASGSPVVPTPSSALPAVVTDHNLLEPNELAALDDGTAHFVTTSVHRNRGETVPDFLQRVRAHYAATMAGATVAVRAQFKLTGTRVSA